MSVFVKICGNTTLDDAQLAVKYGANALGFIFYKPSKRYISPEDAKKIIENLPGNILTVGVFVDEQPQKISTILKEVPLDVLQFHGDETREYCESFAMPYYKVIHVKNNEDYACGEQKYPTAKALLVDTYNAKLKGGTGKTFDWSLLPKNREKPLILAGGLNEDNVAEALQQVKPYGVDVVSGVELSPGVKDKEKLQNFFARVQGQ